MASVAGIVDAGGKRSTGMIDRGYKESAERIYLPAPFAKRNLFYLRNVKFATCVVPSVNVTCNCLQLGAQDFGVCQL